MSPHAEGPVPARTGPSDLRPTNEADQGERSAARQQPEPPRVDRAAWAAAVARQPLTAAGRLVVDGPAPAAQRLRVAADEAAGLIAAAGANRVTVVACLILAAEADGLPRRDAEAILRKALHAGRPS